MKYIMLLTMLFSVLAGPQGFAQTATQAQNTDTQYLPNAGFENGKAGWVTYKNTAQALPVTGQGGTATSTLTTSTTTPISGKASGILTHPASSVQGEGISMPFSLDKDARGQSMQIRGKYEIVSGTYSGGSGLPTPTDSDLEVYVYDVDAGQLIQPSAYKLDGGVIGNTYIINANFQASNTSSNYRLIFHYATTSANAFVVRLDSLKVSSVIKTYGVPAYDLQSAGVNVITALGGATSPTKGTVAVDLVRIGRVGDHARIKGEYRQTAAGAAGGGDYLFQLPNGLSFDSNKVTYYTTSRGTNSTAFTSGGLGTVSITNGNSNQAYGQIYPYDSTHFRINAIQNTVDGSSAGGAGFFGPNFFGLANTSATFNYDFEAPIAGWSSNVAFNSDTGDNRVIAFRGSNTSGFSFPAQAQTVVPFTSNLDSTGAYNGTNAFVVQTPGYYRVSGQLLANVNMSASQNFQTLIYQNGVEVSHGLQNGAGTAAYLNASATGVFQAKAGDTFQIAVYSDVAGSLFNALTYNQFSLEKVVGNTQTAIGESVNATYGLTTAQSVAANGIVKYDTKVKDTHSGYTTGTGLFVAPASGSYRVSIVDAITSGSGSFYVKVNGSSVGYLSSPFNTATSVVSASMSIPVLAGQTIGIYVDTAMTLAAVNPNGFVNQVTFEKTGN